MSNTISLKMYKYNSFLQTFCLKPLGEGLIVVMQYIREKSASRTNGLQVPSSKSSFLLFSVNILGQSGNSLTQDKPLFCSLKQIMIT